MTFSTNGLCFLAKLITIQKILSKINLIIYDNDHRDAIYYYNEGFVRNLKMGIFQERSIISL